MYNNYIILFVGIYSFKVELYELSAAVSVELWISENSDPVKMKQILTLVSMHVCIERCESADIKLVVTFDAGTSKIQFYMASENEK